MADIFLTDKDKLEIEAKLGTKSDKTETDALFNKLVTQNMKNLVVQTIGASQTWIAPKAADQLFKVFCVGGGGGGGAGYNTTGLSDIGGGGGGSGYIEIATLKIGQKTEIDIICGAGGSGGLGSSSDGENGGDTQFGALLTAKGGSGGKRGTSTDGGYGGNGGSGAAGGGGGAGGSELKNTPSAGGNGGNGSLCGGGGAGATHTTSDGNAELAAAGSGGVHGGNGGSASARSRAPKLFAEKLLDVLFQIDMLNVGLNNMRLSGITNKETGYGEGGTGGAGGLNYTNTYSASEIVTEGCGGGGGYCGNGGDGHSLGGSGGGGGYCGNGGNGYYGGGGGGGFFCDGGNSGNTVGGGGGGFFCDGNGSAGGTGGVLIMYIKEE